MSARWQEAYDALLDLRLFNESERGKRYIAGWSGSEVRAHPERRHTLDGVGTRLGAYAFNAEPVWVDPDMQTLWEAACDGFLDEGLHDTDLPTECGFVWLPRPFPWLDVHGKTVTFRAMLWAKTTITVVATEQEADTGSVVSVPNDKVAGKAVRVRTDGPKQTLPGGMVAIDVPGVVVMPFHRAGDPDEYHDEALQTAMRNAGYRDSDLMLDGVFAFPFGQATGADKRTASRPLQVLWRLMSQTIATRERATPPKPFRKRWAKAGMEEKQVVVVRLRRPESRDPETKRTVDWQARWIVSGHWRSAWFSSLGTHRQIWVSAYTKGPDDKPLVVRKARVWEVVR